LTANYDTSIDYFAVLGVHYGACEKTVKAMYRKMARRYHPDVSTIHDAQKRFQEISVAYEILKKYRNDYCQDYERNAEHRKSAPPSHRATRSETKCSEEPSHWARRDSGAPYRDSETHHDFRSSKPIDGKNRAITYPLTLRYAIRLLKLGSFYIPGLKVKMNFTREAFEGKTFRLEGKGYSGLFGGRSGDFLVSFNIQVDCLKFQLEGADIYGAFSVPKPLVKAGNTVQIESPSGRLNLFVPEGYGSNDFIKVPNMGLPADKYKPAGDFYARLISA